MVPLAGDQHMRRNNSLGKNGTQCPPIVSHQLFSDGSRKISVPKTLRKPAEKRSAATAITASWEGPRLMKSAMR